MDKQELDRLRQLAGTAPAVDNNSETGNLYQIRDTLMEAAKPDFADIDGDGDEKETAKKAAKDKEEMEEAAKPDFADIDGDGDEEETAKKAAADKEKMDEAEELDEWYGSKEEWEAKAKDTAKKARDGMKRNWDKSPDNPKNKPKTEQQQMREWANSVYKQYDDRGHYQEQPDGETVDLSLRRYLDANAEPVQIQEDHTVSGMAKAYKDFKGE